MSNVQNIPPLEQEFCNHSQLLLIVLYFPVININSYLLQMHLLETAIFKNTFLNRTH